MGRRDRTVARFQPERDTRATSAYLPAGIVAMDKTTMPLTINADVNDIRTCRVSLKPIAFVGCRVMDCR